MIFDPYGFPYCFGYFRVLGCQTYLCTTISLKILRVRITNFQKSLRNALTNGVWNFKPKNSKIIVKYFVIGGSFQKKKVYIKWFWLFTTLQSITVIVKHNRWSIQHVNTRIVTPAIEKRFFGMKPAPLSLLRVPNLRSRPKILAEKLQLMIHERISTHTRNISPQRAG